MTGKATDVVGIGNAIVDVLVDSTDEMLERHALSKGAMKLVDEATARRLYEELSGGVECSGGSAANTMVGLSCLGAGSAYIGKIAGDALGRTFRGDIQSAGVRFDGRQAAGGPATGRCLVLVTPDAQRTMLTYLGVSAELGPEDVEPTVIEAAGIVYLEGYLWDPAPAKQAFLKAAALARHAGRKVALSLSDAFCVERHRTEFRDLIARHVDILFANESELLSLVEANDFGSAVAAMRGQCELAAVTRGAAGSVVISTDRVIEVPAEPVERVVDTTGAGDLYASGFLFGLTRDRDAETCARLGGIAAAEVISHFGARPRTSLRELAQRIL